jgi:hypothetical protein
MGRKVRHSSLIQAAEKSRTTARHDTARIPHTS